MKRTDWFDEILQAAPSTEEMTSLVTISLFEEEFGSVRLDWWIHVGGYLRLKWEERIILEPKLNLRIGMNPDPVLVAEFNEWLSKTSGEFSFSTTRESRETWERAVPAFSKMSWSEFEPRKEFASRVALPFLSRIDSKWFEDFFKAMGDVGVDLEEPPWILWSRFAPWASRAKGDSWFELDQALTFLRCALSPQDERSEKESLSFDFLMVNPTFETVEKPKSPESREAPILAFARNFDEVHHRALTRLEASVIDQVRESFRASRNHALAVVAGETNVHREFVDSAIEILLDDGYLLGTSNRTSAADGLRDQ